MIYGIDHVSNLFSMIDKLDLSDGEAYVEDAIPNYAVRYGHGVVWDEKQHQELDDELSDLTEEELRIMNVYTPGYQRWFESEYIDKVLLAEDEDD